MPRFRSPIQLAFAKLVGGVVLLDAVAIAAFEMGHVADRGAVFLQRYVIAWTVASALVAAWGLWHVKRARRELATGPDGQPRRSVRPRASRLA